MRIAAANEVSKDVAVVMEGERTGTKDSIEGQHFVAFVARV